MNQHPRSEAEAIKKVAELIKGIKYAMLVTTTEHGHLQSRPMTAQQMTFDGNLWFFTGRSATFRNDVELNPEVNVSFSEPGRNSYVSICGHASFVEDRAKADELWNPTLKAWFPEGVNDPNLILLKVEAHSAHYWDTPSSSVVQVLGMAKAVLTGERYQPGGENEKVEFHH